jgi:hypothetical protein
MKTREYLVQFFAVGDHYQPEAAALIVTCRSAVRARELTEKYGPRFARQIHGSGNCCKMRGVHAEVRTVNRFPLRDPRYQWADEEGEIIDGTPPVLACRVYYGEDDEARWTREVGSP